MLGVRVIRLGEMCLYNLTRKFSCGDNPVSIRASRSAAWHFSLSFLWLMRLAILGTDAEIVDLAAAARDERHEIVWIGDVRPEDAAGIAPTGRLTDRAAEWELLLDRAIADAVLVGKGMATSELRAERIKRLAVEGVPQLVVHPAFDSVLPCYEIDMVRRESGALVQHYNPLMGHPIINEVTNWLRDGHPTIGQIHQVSCERRVAVASREVVLAHFARDVELLGAAAGAIRKVTAIGPTGNDASFASLQIQMIGGCVASLRWSVGYGAAGRVGLDLSLLGENGVATIRVSDGPQSVPPAWQLETTEEGQHDDQPLEEFDPASAAVARLSENVAASHSDRRAGSSTWDAATRAMEVVDAAELSLQKGRTIEVFQQQLTERLAFRGTMAAIGCGLLVLTFLAAVIVAILGGAEGIVRQRLAPAWPLALLLVLAFFLFLQAMPLLARKSNRGDESKPSPPTAHDG
jgi:predicted dehydrogenase